MQDEKQISELDQLKEFKEKSGMTYPKMSKLIGVHEQSVFFWIKGKHSPSPMAREKIRAFLKTYFI